MARRYNPARAKIHRNYSVEEIARLYGVHKNTVRNWLREGLPLIDQRRPRLVHGRDLRAFHEQRRAAMRQKCGPGEFFCLPCRAPRRPAGNMAEFVPISARSGNLRAICPECGRLMHRRVSKVRITAVMPDVEVTFEERD